MGVPKIAILIYDGVNAFELGMAMEVFGLPNMGPNWYDVVVCSEKRNGAKSTSCGVQILASRGMDALDKASMVIVPGWQNIDASPPKTLLNLLRSAHARGARNRDDLRGHIRTGCDGLAVRTTCCRPLG